MQEECIRVVVVDDHVLISQGLIRILEMEDSISVVGQADNGKIALQVIGKLQPDVVLMDINMPEMNGIEATQHIRHRWPKVQVLALTIHDDEDYVSEMIRAGARGYLLKDSEPSKVVQAIQRVKNGETFFPPHLMERVMERFHQLVEEQERAYSLLAASSEYLYLTSREKDVLECIVDGKSNKEIASCLFISEKTVKNHITNLLRKLGVEDRTQAAVLALKKGMFKNKKTPPNTD